jgi:hypothetical protein
MTGAVKGKPPVGYDSIPDTSVRTSISCVSKGFMVLRTK